MTAKSHLARVHAIPCVVCEHMGTQQDSPTIAHHIESIRDDASDYAAVALCQDHHQGSGFGVHDLSRRGFEMRYKLSELDLLKRTLKGIDDAGLMV